MRTIPLFALVVLPLAPLSPACSASNGNPLGAANPADAGTSSFVGVDSSTPAVNVDSSAPPATPSDSGADSSTPIARNADAASSNDANVADPEDAGDAGRGVPEAAAPTQAIAIPMYLDPPSSAWTQETNAASQVPLVVANPDSGPGSSADSSYTQAIATAHAAGQTLIGYVHTSYGARAIADVETDIDSWYSFYPAVDGIFSDETATDGSLVSSYYAPLYAYVKAKRGKGIVVVNPGTPPDEAYMSAADVVLSFEDTYANYGSAQTPAWVASYPASRFWHIVLSATQAEMGTAVTLARQRNAGLIYVTDQGPDTAYQQIVTGAYWEAELAAVSAP